MGFKTGRRTCWKSGQVKRIYQELKRGNKDYQKDAMLCPNKNCKAGSIYDSLTDEQSECPICCGWGIVRKN
ncbi:MAG: hypothetical protein ABSG25_13840 [Bryobacteraceae bacterium]|jgi:hypothetical protein